jgi:hypothetical protein
MTRMWKFKTIMILAIPIILVAALLDVWLIGRMNFKEYLFQCAWEYALFWTGIWIGFYKLRKEVL